MEGHEACPLWPASVHPAALWLVWPVEWQWAWAFVEFFHANLWIITTLNRVSSSIFLSQRFLGEVTGDGTYGRKQGPYGACTVCILLPYSVNSLSFLRAAHPLMCMSSTWPFRTQFNIARQNKGWFLMHFNVILISKNFWMSIIVLFYSTLCCIAFFVLSE